MNSFKIFLLITLAFMTRISIAQNIYISTEQELKFGDFYLSGTAGATVTVSSESVWTSTGEVHLLNPQHQSASFILSTDSTAPVHVQVETQPAVLTNPQGRRMSLQLDTAGTTYHILQQGYPKQIFLGGTLTIDPVLETSKGDYNGRALIRVTIL